MNHNRFDAVMKNPFTGENVNVEKALWQARNALKVSTFTFSLQQIWDNLSRMSATFNLLIPQFAIGPGSRRAGRPPVYFPPLAGFNDIFSAARQGGIQGAVAEGRKVFWAQPKGLLPTLIKSAHFFLAHSEEGRKLAINKLRLDDTPWGREGPLAQLSNRRLVQAGLNTHDQSAFRDMVERTLPDIVDRAVHNIAPALEGPAISVRGREFHPLGSVLGAGNSARMWFQNGLFDTFYSYLMLQTAKDAIAPGMISNNPSWTVDQIAEETARVVNQLYSSQAEWQPLALPGTQVNPHLERIVSWFFTSFNEQRTWIGNAYEALPLPGNTSQWAFRNFFIGWTVLAGIFGVLGWKARNGMASWPGVGWIMPLSTENEPAYGAEYSDDFLEMPLPGSVGIPFTDWGREVSLQGRGGRMLSADLVAQADTVFRPLENKDFFLSRINTGMRATGHQVWGNTFYDEQLDTWYKRGMQLGLDLSPIPVQGAVNYFGERNDWGFMPEGESRIGGAGTLIQLGGVNVRAESNAELRERTAREMGLPSYADAEPWEKADVREALAGELGRTTETGARRGQPWAQFQAAQAQIDADVETGESGMVNLTRHFYHQVRRATSRQEQSRLVWDTLRRYYGLKSERYNRTEEAKRNFGIEDYDAGDTVPSANQQLLDAWHSLDEGATIYGWLDQDKFNARREEFLASLTMPQRRFILRNTNLNVPPPAMMEWLRRYAPSEWDRINQSVQLRESARRGR